MGVGGGGEQYGYCSKSRRSRGGLCVAWGQPTSVCNIPIYPAPPLSQAIEFALSLVPGQCPSSSPDLRTCTPSPLSNHLEGHASASHSANVLPVQLNRQGTCCWSDKHSTTTKKDNVFSCKLWRTSSCPGCELSAHANVHSVQLSSSWNVSARESPRALLRPPLQSRDERHHPPQVCGNPIPSADH